MKKLSETYKELGIAFDFPIDIKDANGNRTYCETSDGYWWRRECDANGKQNYYENNNGYWERSEYDANGNETYFEDSDGYWERREYDANGNKTYFEESNGYKEGIKRKIIKVEAELDDRAFAVGDFIQQLSEVQDQKFEALWKECKEKEWIKGMNEATAKDWLFDYVWNGWGKDACGFEESFSETLSNINGFEVKDHEE